jgi:hypothetical protein
VPRERAGMDGRASGRVRETRGTGQVFLPHQRACSPLMARRRCGATVATCSRMGGRARRTHGACPMDRRAFRGMPRGDVRWPRSGTQYRVERTPYPLSASPLSCSMSCGLHRVGVARHLAGPRRAPGDAAVPRPGNGARPASPPAGSTLRA